MNLNIFCDVKKRKKRNENSSVLERAIWDGRECDKMSVAQLMIEKSQKGNNQAQPLVLIFEFDDSLASEIYGVSQNQRTRFDPARLEDIYRNHHRPCPYQIPPTLIS